MSDSEGKPSRHYIVRQCYDTYDDDNDGVYYDAGNDSFQFFICLRSN